MRQDWEPEDLTEDWTLLEDDMKRLRNTSGANRLGFAMLLKFFEVQARFPETVKEMPAAAVEYVAQQVKVPAEAWAAYGWQGKTVQRHRGEIRAAYGFRANTEEDQERLAEWLAAELCPVELSLVPQDEDMAETAMRNAPATRYSTVRPSNRRHSPRKVSVQHAHTYSSRSTWAALARCANGPVTSGPGVGDRQFSVSSRMCSMSLSRKVARSWASV